MKRKPDKPKSAPDALADALRSGDVGKVADWLRDLGKRKGKGK